MPRRPGSARALRALVAARWRAFARWHAAICAEWSYLAAVGVLIAVAVVGAAWAYVHALEQREISSAGQELATLAATVAEDIDAILLKRTHALDVVATGLGVDGISPATVATMLREERESHPDTVFVGVVDATGRMTAASDPSLLAVDRSDRTWFVGARDHGERRIFGPHFVEVAPTELTIGMAAPIASQSGEFLGVVREEVSVAALLYDVRRRVRILGDESNRRGASIEWVLLDRDGLVIAESDLDEAGRANLRKLGTASARLASAADGTWVVEKHERLGRSMVTGYADTGGTRLALPTWRILLRVGERDVVNPLRALMWRTVAYVVVVLLPLVAWFVQLVVQRRRAEAALRTAHESLELRIAERTRELVSANTALEAALRQHQSTENALRVSETRWRTLSELTSDWAYAYRRDADGRISLEWVSDAFTRATGYSLEDVQERGLLSLVHPEDRLEVRARIRAQAEGLAADGESRLVTHGGEVRWVRDRGTRALRDPATGAVVVYGAAEDITDRKRAEEELRHREAELADFFENAPVGLHWAGPDGHIERANRAELELLGYTHDEYVGRPIREFYVDEAIIDDFRERLARGETLNACEARLRCKDGSIRHVLVDANVLFRDSRFVHTRYFTRDVTDQHRANELLEVGRARAEEQARELEQQTFELEQARNAALDAVRAKSEFLANMSHEIRTPMTAILGYAGLLMEARLPRRDRQEYVETIRRNGEYLLGLINDILDLSKLEAGKMIVESVPCSPAELVREVGTMLRGRATGKGLAFEVAIDDAVPAAVLTDPTRVRQILVNLVGNAIKFTETGGVRVVVDVDGSSGEGRVGLRFAVTDSGIGMTDEERARLFEPFAQADASTTRRFGGTGLGLAISWRLAELLGGSLAVTTAPAEGSTFTFTLDVAITEGVPVAAPTQDRPEEPAPRLRARVLLAEDAPDSQRLIAFYLRKAGAEVEVAGNGRLACEQFRAASEAGRTFDLVVMDMQMPEMDGYEATAALRRAGVRTPIIALTAHALRADRQRCLDAGCTDYLPKPVDRSMLLQRLHSHLDVDREPAPARAAAKRPAAAALCDTDDPEMRELLTLFVSGLQERADAIEASLERRDADRLAGLAHQLKGTARAYGFPQLTDEAGSLEASLLSGQCLDEVRDKVRCVIDLCRAARCQ
jgi:PAS domain S-box-containing protein